MMNNFVEVMEVIGSIIGTLLTIMTFVGIISKKPKEWFRRLIREESIAANQGLATQLTEIQNHLKESDETDQTILRNNITHIYFKYKKDKQIPHFEKENVLYLAEQYDKLNGNSYVKQIVKEIKTWDEIS